MKILNQPIKVIDDFFEAPEVWQHYASKQEFSSNENSTWPGLRTNTLDQLNIDLFNSFASKLIKHIHDRKYFSFLKVNFALVDESFNIGWIHQDEPRYNVAGVLFLNKSSPPNSGISFYTKNMENNNISNYNESFFDEIKSHPNDRNQFIKIKEEQRSHFKKNMTVENIFNRCVIFPPDSFHAADSYFGTTKEDSRLSITFFGVAV